MKNYYRVLGLESSATDAEIRVAYRKLALVFHPDAGGNPERFREIAEAYEVLSNPAKREALDKEDPFPVEISLAFSMVRSAVAEMRKRETGISSLTSMYQYTPPGSRDKTVPEKLEAIAINVANEWVQKISEVQKDIQRIQKIYSEYIGTLMIDRLKLLAVVEFDALEKDYRVSVEYLASLKAARQIIMDGRKVPLVGSPTESTLVIGVRSTES